MAPEAAAGFAIMDGMQEMFRDVLQQVMKSELETELGYKKSAYVRFRHRKQVTELPQRLLEKDG